MLEVTFDHYDELEAVPYTSMPNIINSIIKIIKGANEVELKISGVNTLIRLTKLKLLN